MRILVRTSKWAIWARRLGSFALPLAVIPVLMHRSGVITPQTFEIVEIVATSFALLGLVVSIGALIRIWSTGDQGWARAVAGLVLSLFCLAPAGVWVADYLRYPMADEVSTDPANPPPLLSTVAAEPLSAGITAQIASAFPNVKTRRYPLGILQLFDIVNGLAVDRGWDVRARQEPATDLDTGQLNAIATTLFGFRDEVSIHLVGDADGTSVAMRSISLSRLHEPGINGSRIEEFLTALDQKVTLMMKDEPAGAGPDTDTDNTAADQTPVIPATPSPRERKR